MRCCFLFSLLALIACDSGKRDVHNATANGLFSESCAFMKSSDYSEAANGFREIEKLFPYSSRAAEGLVLSAYCNFRAGNYMDSIRELDIFLKYRSSHRFAAYASYLRATCMYMRVSSIGRDSSVALDARKSFMEVATRFPDSIYCADCLKKAEILDNVIAAHEMVIGRFYQKRKNIIGAIGRYLAVIQDFESSNLAPEALYRGVECFLSLGMMDEVISLKKTLGAKYPTSKWYKKAVTLCRNNGVREQRD